MNNVQSRRFITVVACCIVGLAFVVCGSYYLGARSAESRHQLELQRIYDEYATRLGELERANTELATAMDSVQGSVSKLRGELGTILGSGRSLRDQLRGITGLFDVLDNFIGQLFSGLQDGSGSDDSTTGGGNSVADESGNIP